MMPFVSYDPTLEFECFRHIKVPDDVVIPTSDAIAWTSFPQYREVYNKLNVALSQEIDAAPSGVDPSNFPVFMKPVFNMWNWGRCSYLVRSPKELDAHNHPGLFWMEFLQGDHLSVDLALLNGTPVWSCTFQGHPLEKGTFDFWETVECPPEVLEHLTAWARRFLGGYTGSVNFETIGGKIIEVHLRMGDIDKFGDAELLQSIVTLYASKQWTYFSTLPKLYIFALFGTPGPRYELHLAEAAEICRHVFCWRVWDVSAADQRHRHPPGGVRLAQLCSHSYEVGLSAREELRRAFRETETVHR